MTTTCSFCGKSSAVIGPMAEGPNDVYICGPCLQRSKEILLALAGTPTCSFCGKTVPAASCVEGPGQIHMCSRCVELATKIVEDQLGKPS